MKPSPIYMTHYLKQIPVYTLPEGYQFRFYENEGDQVTWAQILTATNEFPNKQQALERFKTELSPYESELTKRLFFIETVTGELVGTATAWFGEWAGEEIGRLHWIEILPDYQNKGLGKALIAKAMEVIAYHHEKAYLKTQHTSEAAIYLYKQFGWELWEA